MFRNKNGITVIICISMFCSLFLGFLVKYLGWLEIFINFVSGKGYPGNGGSTPTILIRYKYLGGSVNEQACVLPLIIHLAVHMQ
jgi:hypothetical protein